jgi:hypothetical protein
MAKASACFLSRDGGRKANCRIGAERRNAFFYQGIVPDQENDLVVRRLVHSRLLSLEVNKTSKDTAPVARPDKRVAPGTDSVRRENLPSNTTSRPSSHLGDRAYLETEQELRYSCPARSSSGNHNPLWSVQQI